MPDVTRILTQIEAGDPSAAERLLPAVYDELRKLATRWLAAESPGQTIQPTALVHEAYLRLIGAKHQQQWDSSGHFFGAAAQAMRRILIENARRRKSLKKGGRLNRVDLELTNIEMPAEHVDVVHLDHALTKLAARDERKARLVELRFFAGLTLKQAAATMGISIATAQRDWIYARAWLHREIGGGVPPSTKPSREFFSFLMFGSPRSLRI